MKKKLLIGFAVLTLGLVAAFNMSLNAGKSNLSMLSLANIEALAQNENDDKPDYDYVRYPKEGDDDYGITKCVCTGKGTTKCC